MANRLCRYGDVAHTNDACYGVPASLCVGHHALCDVSSTTSAFGIKARMSDLTDKAHWDAVHVTEQKGWHSHLSDTRRVQADPVARRVARRVKRWLGPDRTAYLSSYPEYLFMEVLLPRYIPSLKGSRVLEVGSAPGELLVQMARRFECEPFGVEYSAPGAALNRDVFRANGINPDNVIEADAFDPTFQRRHGGVYDVVISRGLVEHFSDPRRVVNDHAALLAPGGYLVVSIPNLAGVNYHLAKFFDKDLLRLHNLEIMAQEPFRELFEEAPLEPLYCGYYGTFDFYLFYSHAETWRGKVARMCHTLQPAFNYAFRTLLKDKGAETRTFSPSLLFIGRKRPQ